jgi:dTDP-glucose 4,6-dehydratase
VVDITTLAKLVIELTGADTKLASYQSEEGFTTKVKTVDYSKSRKDLKHEATINLKEGLTRYIKWMRKIYEV